MFEKSISKRKNRKNFYYELDDAFIMRFASNWFMKVFNCKPVLDMNAFQFVDQFMIKLFVTNPLLNRSRFYQGIFREDSFSVRFPVSCLLRLFFRRKKESPGLACTGIQQNVRMIRMIANMTHCIHMRSGGLLLPAKGFLFF